MAKLLKTSITGSSGTTSLLVSGSSILMPGMSGSVDSGSAGQMYVDFAPRNRGLKMKLTQAGSFGSATSPYTCLGAWQTEASLPTGKSGPGGGFGESVSSAVAAGGFTPSGATSETVEYNGTSWATGGSLAYARYSDASAGTQNAGILYGGYLGSSPNDKKTCTEEYNGTAWSAGGAMSIARRKLGGSGGQNDALAAGGDTVPSTTNAVEEYNGAAWSTGGSMAIARYYPVVLGCGTPSAIAVGGPSLTTNEEYNGATWSTATTSLTCAYGRLGAGSSFDAILFGGYIAPAGQTRSEEWNGNIWSISNSLPCFQSFATNNGSVNSALSAGGPSYASRVQSYNKSLSLPFTFNSAADSNSWSGGPLLLINRNGMGSAGTQNAALGFGGYRAPTGTAGVTCNEEFNGTTWSAGGALSIARYAIGGFGTQNAGAAAGGQTPTRLTATEEYDGSSWTAGGSMINARGRYAATGTQNAGLAIGGYGAPSAASISNVEEYDGTTWTNGGALISSVYSQGGSGTQNAGLSFLGANIPSGNTNKTEEYDGSSWATAATANVTRNDASAGFGTQNATIATTGFVSPTGTTCTEFYDGTTWAMYPASLTIATNVSSAGDADEGLIFGGNTYSTYAGRMTQFWNANTPTCSTTPFCLTTWSAGDNTIVGFCSSAGFGTGAAAAVAGGCGNQTTTNEYNGTTWSAANALNKGRVCVVGTGTQTAGLAIGGVNPGILTCVEEYDGTDWTNGGALITQRAQPGTAGTQNAGLMFGGEQNNVGVTTTEEYNGTAWSSANAMINASAFLAGTGTQNAGLKFGGGHPSGHACTEQYDGTTWAAGGALNNARFGLAGAGTQFDAWAMGGNSVSQRTENYNGVTWSIYKAMPIGQDLNSGTGGASSTNMLSIGGAGNTCATQRLEYANYCPGIWSLGPVMIIANQGYSGRAGIQSSFSTVASSGDQDSHEIYNGTAWGLHTCYPTPGRSLAGAGADADNTVYFGGFPGHANTNEWNGVSWSATGNLITALYYNTGAGTQDSAGTVMGYNGAYRACHENYNGSTWSTATASPIVMQLPGAGGSSADSHGYAGGGDYTEGVSSSGTMATWNGSAWAEGASLNTTRYANAGNGTVNAWLVFGGECGSAPYPPQKDSEEFDGTAWSTKGNMLVGGAFGYAGGSGATAVAGIGAGRYALPAGNASCVEEWNVCNPVNQGIYNFTKSL